jgi:threonine aldolase
MDGARCGNAAVALGVPLRELCRDVDSVSMCLSKGLGAPVGTLVAGDEKFVLRVRRAKKALGGGWRQAGILAAAGLIALDTMQETLTRDHALAKSFASEIAKVPGIHFPRLPATNLVFFEVTSMPLDVFAAKVAEHGLLIGYGYGRGGKAVRAVVHKDVSKEDVEEAASIIRKMVG